MVWCKYVNGVSRLQSQLQSTEYHDYNRNYIRLETSSEQKQNPFPWFDVSMFSDYRRYESIKQTKFLIGKE